MDRLVLALVIPLGVIVVVFIIIFGLSRILLGVNDSFIATTIALIASLIVLGVCIFLANRPGGSRA